MFSIGYQRSEVYLRIFQAFVPSQRNNKVMFQLGQCSPFPFSPFRCVLFSRYMQTLWQVWDFCLVLLCYWVFLSLELSGWLLYSRSQFIFVSVLNSKCQLKGNLLHSLVNKKCLSFLQDWGKPGDLWNLDIQWHVPSSEEINFAFYLLDTFLQPELIRLEHYAAGKLEMSRLVGIMLYG